MVASAALCIGFHPASASLLGMPLNLKVAIELSDLGAPAPVCQFYTDEVLSGPCRSRISDKLESARGDGQIVLIGRHSRLGLDVSADQAFLH